MIRLLTRLGQQRHRRGGWEGCEVLAHASGRYLRACRQYNLFDSPFRFHGYEPLFTELAMSMGSHLRAWVRVAHKAPPAVAAVLTEPKQVHSHKGGYIN